MQITLAHVGSRRAAELFDSQVQQYLKRCSPLAQCAAQAFKSEEAFLSWLDRQRGRSPAIAALLHGSGRPMSSEAFAEWLGKQRDEGAQNVVFAVGPADGWSAVARGRAQLLLSLGPMTYAHGVARLVAAEQIYRACTILTGHPYHKGH